MTTLGIDDLGAADLMMMINYKKINGYNIY